VDAVEPCDLRELEALDEAQAEQRPGAIGETGERGRQRVAKLAAIQRLEVEDLRIRLAIDDVGEGVVPGVRRRSPACVEGDAPRRDRDPRAQRPGAAIAGDPGEGAGAGDDEANPGALRDLVDERRIAVDRSRGRGDVPGDQLAEPPRDHRVAAADRERDREVAGVCGRGPRGERGLDVSDGVVDRNPRARHRRADRVSPVVGAHPAMLPRTDAITAVASIDRATLHPKRLLSVLDAAVTVAAMRIHLALALVACHSSRGSHDGATVPEPTATPGEARAEPSPPPSPPTPHGDIATWVALDRPFLVDHIAAGQDVRCAVSRAGQVACWGDLTNQQSGPVEIKAGLSTPRLLAGVDDAVDVAFDWFYVCVAQRAGTGHCFAVKDLGFRMPQFPSPPEQLAPGLVGICARMRDGKVGCIDSHGRYTPIAGIEHATQLACSRDMTASCCAAMPSGLACFGNGDDQLGITKSETTAKPLARKLPAATAIALDRGSACVRTKTGAAQCWGEAEKLSRASGVRAVGVSDEGLCLVLDDGTLACKSDRIPATKHAVQVAHACTVHDDGSVHCWGDNRTAQLGDGGLTASMTPVRVPNLDNAVDLQVAHTMACAVRKTKTMRCWGVADAADLDAKVTGPLVPGQYIASCRIAGARVECTEPTLGGDWSAIEFAPKLSSIKSAAIHRDGSICVVDGNGRVACLHGMADNGMDEKWRALPAPGPVEDLQPLGVGFCARQRDERVSCFVDHRYDEDDKFLDKAPNAKLVLVPKLEHVVQLATGQEQACAITKAGEVWCWSEDHRQPVEVPALRGATAIAANHLHTCAIVRREVWCWGENDYGQLGDGHATELADRVTVPVRANLPFEAVKIGVGRDSTCALATTGHVWCWGSNADGQLGIPHRRSSEQPLRVVGFGT